MAATSVKTTLSDAEIEKLDEEHFNPHNIDLLGGKIEKDDEILYVRLPKETDAVDLATVAMDMVIRCGFEFVPPSVERDKDTGEYVLTHSLDDLKLDF